MKTGPKPKVDVFRNKHGQIVCEHNRAKHQCKECGGSSYCEHGTRKFSCHKCGGAGICLHGKRKERCESCDGSALCSHGVGKSQCKKCGGSGICSHNRERRRCSICDPGGAFKKCKVGAFIRELSFNLTLEDFQGLVSLSCYFCGDNNQPRGIDRWDNTVGYEKANCVPCCLPCNFAKKTMIGSDFISMCQRVSRVHKI
jgi:hypothetical protein